MTPIGHLVDEVQKAFLDQHGTSLSLQAICDRMGPDGVSKQTLSAWMRQPPLKLPAPEVVAAVARGLRVAEGLVLQRLMESVGYTIPETFPVAARRGFTAKELGRDELDSP